MPALPIVALPTTVDGATGIEYRSLTRKEARHVTIGFHVADPEDLAGLEAAADACEVYILACGLSRPEEEVAEWRAASDSGTVERIVEGILSLSGMRDGPSPQARTSVP